MGLDPGQLRLRGKPRHGCAGTRPQRQPTTGLSGPDHGGPDGRGAARPRPARRHRRCRRNQLRQCVRLQPAGTSGGRGRRRPRHRVAGRRVRQPGGPTPPDHRGEPGAHRPGPPRPTGTRLPQPVDHTGDAPVRRRLTGEREPHRRVSDRIRPVGHLPDPWLHPPGHHRRGDQHRSPCRLRGSVQRRVRRSRHRPTGRHVPARERAPADAYRPADHDRQSIVGTPAHAAGHP